MKSFKQRVTKCNFKDLTLFEKFLGILFLQHDIDFFQKTQFCCQDVHSWKSGELSFTVLPQFAWAFDVLRKEDESFPVVSIFLSYPAEAGSDRNET
jgi:hypothetical protein